MSISDNDFISDGIDDWLSDGIDGTIQIKFVKPNERRRSGGTLFRRNESDIYTARFIDADGRRVDRSTGCTSIAEAEAVLDRMVSESRASALQRKNGPKTIRQIIEESKHKTEASNRLVVLRREVIELHDLAEDGGFRCVPYRVHLDEVRTKAGQIEWIRHLCEKSWITPTHILKFIDACESARARKENAR